MKFLFTGTICVGKSTVLEDLGNQNINGVAIVREAAQDILNVSPHLAVLSPTAPILPNKGDFIFEEQKRREMAAEAAGAKIILCDRGPLDIIAHSKVFGSSYKPEWKEWMNWMSTYDQIFYFSPKDVPFDEKKYPPGRDWKRFREDLDTQTKLLLQETKLRYTELSGSVEGKSNMVRFFIFSAQTNPEGQYRTFKER